jgi:hypothetical protein
MHCAISYTLGEIARRCARRLLFAKPSIKSYEVSVPAETSSRVPPMFHSFRHVTDHLIY